jgi:hypothetical protein
MPFIIFERECQHEGNCKEPNCSCPMTPSALIRERQTVEEYLVNTPGAIVEEWEFLDDEDEDDWDEEDDE